MMQGGIAPFVIFSVVVLVNERGRQNGRHRRDRRAE